jgi:hypothetical protein
MENVNWTVERLKVLLYNAIIMWADNSEAGSCGIDSEYFYNQCMTELGMTKEEVNSILNED